LAVRIVTYRRAINSFAPYKSPGVDGIFLALLQKAQEVVIPHLVRIFHACLLTGYVPAIWGQVKVVFIPKPSRNCYSGPRDYRPITLTSSFLKTLERLVDRYLRDVALKHVPLHSNQVLTRLANRWKWLFISSWCRLRRPLTNRRQPWEFF